jgi:hypothetical protein
VIENIDQKWWICAFSAYTHKISGDYNAFLKICSPFRSTIDFKWYWEHVNPKHIEYAYISSHLFLSPGEIIEMKYKLPDDIEITKDVCLQYHNVSRKLQKRIRLYYYNEWGDLPISKLVDLLLIKHNIKTSRKQVGIDLGIYKDNRPRKKR